MLRTALGGLILTDGKPIEQVSYYGPKISVSAAAFEAAGNIAEDAEIEFLNTRYELNGGADVFGRLTDRLSEPVLNVVLNDEEVQALWSGFALDNGC
jgi:ribosomal protein S16